MEKGREERTHWSLPAFSSSPAPSRFAAPKPNPARTPLRLNELLCFMIVELLPLCCIDRGGVRGRSAARAFEGVRGGEGGMTVCDVEG